MRFGLSCVAAVDGVEDRHTHGTLSAPHLSAWHSRKLHSSEEGSRGVSDSVTHTHTHTTFLSLSLSLSPLTGFLIYDSNSLVQMQPALITVYMYFILLPSPCLSFCAFTFPCTAWLIIPSTLSTVFLIFQKYNLSQQHERKRERLWGPNVKHPY